MFKKEINPYSVADKVTFRNIDKTLTLYVRSNAGSMILGLKEAQERLKDLTDDSNECQRMNAAHFFAKQIFGDEQSDQLMSFYNNDPLAIISAVGIYFDQRLKYLITKAQKK